MLVFLGAGRGTGVESLEEKDNSTTWMGGEGSRDVGGVKLRAMGEAAMDLDGKTQPQAWATFEQCWMG